MSSYGEEQRPEAGPSSRPPEGPPTQVDLSVYPTPESIASKRSFVTMETQQPYKRQKTDIVPVDSPLTPTNAETRVPKISELEEETPYVIVSYEYGP